VEAVVRYLERRDLRPVRPNCPVVGTGRQVCCTWRPLGGELLGAT